MKDDQSDVRRGRRQSIVGQDDDRRTGRAPGHYERSGLSQADLLARSVGLVFVPDEPEKRPQGKPARALIGTTRLPPTAHRRGRPKGRLIQSLPWLIEQYRGQWRPGGPRPTAAGFARALELPDGPDLAGLDRSTVHGYLKTEHNLSWQAFRELAERRV